MRRLGIVLVLLTVGTYVMADLHVPSPLLRHPEWIPAMVGVLYLATYIFEPPSR